MSRARKKMRRSFSSVSLPVPLVERIEKVVKNVGYWPTKTAFIREACLDKLEKYKDEKLLEAKV